MKNRLQQAITFLELSQRHLRLALSEDYSAAQASDMGNTLSSLHFQSEQLSKIWAAAITGLQFPGDRVQLGVHLEELRQQIDRDIEEILRVLEEHFITGSVPVDDHGEISSLNSGMIARIRKIIAEDPALGKCNAPGCACEGNGPIWLAERRLENPDFNRSPGEDSDGLFGGIL